MSEWWITWLGGFGTAAAILGTLRLVEIWAGCRHRKVMRELYDDLNNIHASLKESSYQPGTLGDEGARILGHECADRLEERAKRG